MSRIIFYFLGWVLAIIKLTIKAFNFTLVSHTARWITKASKIRDVFTAHVDLPAAVKIVAGV